MSYNRRKRHPDAGKIVKFVGKTISLTPVIDGECWVEDWWDNLPSDPYRIRYPHHGVRLPVNSVYVKINGLGHWITDSQIVRERVT